MIKEILLKAVEAESWGDMEMMARIPVWRSQLGMALMLYRENDGMVRGFSIGGIMIGMLLYYFLLSRFVIRINVMVFGTVFGLLGKIFGTILLPFRKHGKKIIHFFRKRLKKVCRAVKIGLCKL